MQIQDLPKTDSIEELARFWDSHDLTQSEGNLEEVTEPAFDQKNSIPSPAEGSRAAKR